MNRSFRIVAGVVLASFALLSCLPAAGADDKPKAEKAAAAEKGKGDEKGKVDEKEPSVWMRKKLDYSQAILSGIATADFDKIATNAQAMQGLSKIEAFVRSRTPGYRTQLQIFMEANAEIIRQADKDNVDGAALAFTQMTISCVNCHKQLRAEMK